MERQCYVNSGACPAGEQAGCSHPSSRLGGAGDRHSTVRLAPNLFVFPLSRAFRGPGCEPLQFCPAGLLPIGSTGEGRRVPWLPPRHPFRTSKAPPSIVCACGQWPRKRDQRRPGVGQARPAPCALAGARRFLPLPPAPPWLQRSSGALTGLSLPVPLLAPSGLFFLLSSLGLTSVWAH